TRRARDTGGWLACAGRGGGVRREPLRGNAARGAQVYESAGCAACHTIRGRGGAMGPDLTDVGVRSSPSYLRRSIVEPQTDVPTGFRQMRATTRDGRRLTGIRVNEDTFSIQFRDVGGVLYSFFKEELTELRTDEGRTAMPSFRARLEPAALDDLVA